MIDIDPAKERLKFRYGFRCECEPENEILNDTDNFLNLGKNKILYCPVCREARMYVDEAA